jgi:hypothetical protein
MKHDAKKQYYVIINVNYDDSPAPQGLDFARLYL